MIPLLQRISASRNIHAHSRLVVVSDANNFFIETYLDSRKPPVVPDAIITNQAEKTDDGYLKLTPYEHQVKCPLCPRNLCKGAALLKYIEWKGPFNRVFYTGNSSLDALPLITIIFNYLSPLYCSQILWYYLIRLI